MATNHLITNRLTGETIDENNSENNELRTVSNISEIDSFIEIKVTWYRWLVLGLWLLCGILAAAISITLTPCSTLISQAYNVPLLQVSLCTLCFGMTAVPMFFISMKMYTVVSTAWTLRLGCLILVIGCWIRQLCTFDNNQFWPVIVGSFIISLSNPILLSA